MKIKTNLKAGQSIGDSINKAANSAVQVIKRSGQQAGAAVQNVTKTVTNPEFWTWPW